MANGRTGTLLPIDGNVIPEDSSFIFLLIHSDDIIIVSHNETIMIAAKAALLQAFEGTDNGNLSSFCGVEIRSSEGRVSLSMEYYWNKLMLKFNVKDDETENSPLNWTLNFFKDVTVLYGMDFVFFCNVDAAHADDDETHRSTGG
jgi:hypothetical protein